MGKNAAGEITDGIYLCNGDEQIRIFRFTVIEDHTESLVEMIRPVKVEQYQCGILSYICQAVVEGGIIVSIPLGERQCLGQSLVHGFYIGDVGAVNGDLFHQGSP